MAEEETAVAPPAEPEKSATLKDFGDLSEVFDKVFPSTAEKKEPESPSPTPASTPATPPLSESTPASESSTSPPSTPTPPSAATPAQDELPDFLTGKKTEEPPKPAEPDLELPPIKGKESANMTMFREKFDLVKSKARAREQELIAQVEELKKAPATAPDAEATIEQLKKQVEELSGAVERSAIEFHPAFRAEFVDKRAALVNDAHEILKEAKSDPTQWDRAMALTGAARTEALEAIYDELPRSVTSELGSAAREIRSLDARRDAYLTDRKGLHERLQQDNLRQQHEQMKQYEKSTLEMMAAAEKDLIDRMGIEVYKTSDNPEHKKWNESVERMKADARKIMLETTDPSVMARAAYLAPAAIQYRYLYHVMRDRWQDAENRLKAIEKSEPDAKTKGEVSTAEDDNLSFADAVARQVFSK